MVPPALGPRGGPSQRDVCLWGASPQEGPSLALWALEPELNPGLRVWALSVTTSVSPPYGPCIQGARPSSKWVRTCSPLGPSFFQIVSWDREPPPHPHSPNTPTSGLLSTSILWGPHMLFWLLARMEMVLSPDLSTEVSM